MLACVFKLLARLPLPVLHRLGDGLGTAAFYLLPATRRRVRRHLQIADLPARAADVRQVLRETAKSGLELPLAFYRPTGAIRSLFVQTHGWEHIETALHTGKGLLLLTPHLGSYDLAGRYISERLPHPLTALYKPPKIKWLDDIMQQGRQRGNGRTAPASAQGVKQIVKALRGGESTIVLPDHVPDPHEGGGVWADFFGTPAYTATLAAKLAQVKNVQTLFFCGERLPCGQGFALHIEPAQGAPAGKPADDALWLNRNLERLIRRFPQQYLFAYNRYKHPAGAPPPPHEAP
ncbi:lysophospholipid acyltransferase family protein [Conchiformibius kuhniae]|uniref:Lysophospholipid acyltransferase family protein n=1 Tax=Conchiformibius kuhniae TaxID=211502 RepID=A0A8T9MYQ8_9NEIS|nr:lysophospholipid acyltransferase family protein [Conchiformibius kuhniae]UOP05618.1 lysophospholipid acyltransferase family protein [Conchiformibius kuhniae]